MRRLKIVPDHTNFDFFKHAPLTFGVSMVAMVVSVILVLTMGLNFGIDFKGGTSIRTESAAPVNVGAYRAALEPLGLGDLSLTEVFDPSFGSTKNVAMIRIEAQSGDEAVTQNTVNSVQSALQKLDPTLAIQSVESVGPKVSGELIWSAIIAILGATAAIMIYIWLRFEWQFSIGAAVAEVHDVVVTVGIFALFQIRFDLTTIAALLTILGYSINDTVVVFDRLRENLVKFKVMPLRDVMNLSVNETLSRTLMTSGTTLIALIALLVLGGDVIRGFVFAITWGIVVGTYSSVYVAKNVVLFLGVTRDGKKDGGKAGTQFSNIDA